MAAPRWSDLSPDEREIKLAEVGWTLDDVDDLVLASYDDPKLRPIMERLTSREAKRRKVLDWYGDQQHPLPKKRERVGIFAIDLEPARELRHYVDGELARRAPDLDSEDVVIDDPAPGWVPLPPLEEDEPAAEEQPKAKKPRHRPPDPIPRETVKNLQWELGQRRAKPRDPELTQEKIALRVRLDRSRILQAEALQRAGWDLLRTHPDFSAEDGFVRWPSPEQAARILASERAEN